MNFLNIITFLGAFLQSCSVLFDLYCLNIIIIYTTVVVFVFIRTIIIVIMIFLCRHRHRHHHHHRVIEKSSTIETNSNRRSLKSQSSLICSDILFQEAKESLAFYRNIKVDSKEIMQEIETIRRTLNPELDEPGKY